MLGANRGLTHRLEAEGLHCIGLGRRVVDLRCCATWKEEENGRLWQVVSPIDDFPRSGVGSDRFL